MNFTKAAEHALFDVDPQGRTVFFPDDAWREQKAVHGVMWERSGYLLESEKQRKALLNIWRLRWGVDVFTRSTMPVILWLPHGLGICVAVAGTLSLILKQVFKYPVDESRRVDFLLNASEMRLWHETHGRIPKDSLAIGVILTSVAVDFSGYTSTWWATGAWSIAAGTGAALVLRLPTFLWVPRAYRLACCTTAGVCVVVAIFLARQFGGSW